MLKNRKVSAKSSAVVTGAGSGIGRAFAIELAQRGGRVVCADINKASAEDTVRLIEAQGAVAWGVQCDVSDAGAVVKLADEAEQLLGQSVDLVINNAGVGIGGHAVGDISLEDWRWTMGVNLWGVIHGCHVFAPKLKALGRGGILNVVSTAGFSAAPGMSPYNVTKAGALALTETLAAEMAGTGVKVSALCPTFVKTNIVRDGRISEESSKFASKLMQWSGKSADDVARSSLNALDAGRLYEVPQIDAKVIWRAKRFAPSGYARGLGLLNRFSGKFT